MPGSTRLRLSGITKQTHFVGVILGDLNNVGYRYISNFCHIKYTL